MKELAARLGAYAKLVAMAAAELDAGRQAEETVKAVHGLTESQAKSMLKGRIVADAVESLERAKPADDPLEGLGPDPTLH